METAVYDAGQVPTLMMVPTDPLVVMPVDWWRRWSWSEWWTILRCMSLSKTRKLVVTHHIVQVLGEDEDECMVADQPGSPTNSTPTCRAAQIPVSW